MSDNLKIIQNDSGLQTSDSSTHSETLEMDISEHSSATTLSGKVSSECDIKDLAIVSVAPKQVDLPQQIGNELIRKLRRKF